MHLFFVGLSAGAIVYLALKMLTPTLFSPQHRVPLYMNPNSLWGFHKTSIVAVDANLSKFDPEETLKKIFDGDFSPERLRAYFEPEGFSLTGCDSGGLSSGFEIRPADGSWSARMKAELIQAKKKPLTLLMWGPVPKENLEKIFVKKKKLKCVFFLFDFGDTFIWFLLLWDLYKKNFLSIPDTNYFIINSRN